MSQLRDFNVICVLSDPGELVRSGISNGGCFEADDVYEPTAPAKGVEGHGGMVGHAKPGR